MGDVPLASVIIPVRNRRDLLRLTLDALAAQTFTDFEVIVIDDGSTDGSAEEATADAAAGRPVHVVAGNGEGAVAARIIGVDKARGKILVFTDSDCVPAPGWLAAGVEAVLDGADVVNGLTQPIRPLRPLERSLGSGREGLYPTCNMFFRREAYEAAGGFDAGAGARWGFRPGRGAGLGFGEDTLLAWRVRRAGEARYVPEALVYHAVLDFDLADMVNRNWQIAAFPALLREVPELRDTLLFKRRVLLQPKNRLPLHAAVAALLTGHKRAAAAAAVVWVAYRFRDLGKLEATLGERVQALPVELLIDVVTATALMLGSARTGKLVL